jgi:three-Cys-motif partner protein
MPRTTLWPLEPHTEAKHRLLQRYLGAWFPILSRSSGRIVFFDGFAGPGEFEGGEPGSPILALQTLLDHQFLERMTRCEFLLIFYEADDRRYEHLVRKCR